MVDISDPKWSEQDVANNGAAPDGIQGAYAPSTIAPILRSTRGAVKRERNRINAVYTTSGTATALALTFAVAPDALRKGDRYAFFASQTNTGAMTLNVNGLGAKAILQQDGAALAAAQIVSGSATTVIYDGAAFRLENYVSNPKFTGTLSVDAVAATTITTSGAMTASGTVTSGNVVSAGLTINGAAGTDRVIGWQSAGKQRWSAFTNSGSESGSNNGSDFAIARYADNGNYIDAPLLISRVTGNIFIEKQLNVKGRVYAGTGGTFLETDGNIVFTGSMTSQGSTLSEALGRKAPLASPNFSGVVGLPGVSANEFKQGNADGASYGSYNLAMKGWWGMGMQDHTNTVNGYYDFRVNGTPKAARSRMAPNTFFQTVALTASTSLAPLER
ncbi:hypothetical protein [Agrobacterium rosae]|uniref:hypothetical protein n=1 Tax=Agrobacterium rosae TaxID=1972867 RepID=UPI000CD9E75C|nr:hypothetical protein [Agrobacterium rosae]POO56244.1 hypothetical protein CTT39_05780 [Agrobacterium rosae]